MSSANADIYGLTPKQPVIQTGKRLVRIAHQPGQASL
jgi:DUF971 family protein